jgi:hypothetical protein
MRDLRAEEAVRVWNEGQRPEQSRTTTENRQLGENDLDQHAKAHGKQPRLMEDVLRSGGKGARASTRNGGHPILMPPFECQGNDRRHRPIARSIVEALSSSKNPKILVRREPVLKRHFRG